MSKLALVASAMSSIIGYPVKTYDECVANGLEISPAQILDLDSIYRYSFNDDYIHENPSVRYVRKFDTEDSIYGNPIVSYESYDDFEDPTVTQAISDSSILVRDVKEDTEVRYVRSFNDEDSIHGNPIVRYDPTPTQDISDNLIQIFVKTLVGGSQAIFVNPRDTVLEFKHAIRTKFGIDNRQVRLIFSGKQLDDSRTLATYNIRQGDTVHILFRLRGGFDFYVIKKEFLDPRFDYDFTNRKDDGKHVRGKLLYKRPYGWERIALNVLGRYGSDHKWLGHVGDSSDEWPVSYHGTRRSVANNIADKGYLLSKGRRFLYGLGIYSSPEIEVAEGYAATFYHKGDYYKVVFQNRVNHVGLEKHDNIWVTPDEKNIRPYGLCVKKVKPTLFDYLLGF